MDSDNTDMATYSSRLAKQGGIVIPPVSVYR